MDLNTKAIPFIIYNDNNEFEISQEAKDFLSNIKESICVLSIAGKYRTGKSYLLNKIILQSRQSFNVGNTINPCTKGLWLYPEVIKEGGKSIIIIDTEGFGGIDEGIDHDSRIFIFSVLLSSYFIYNSAGSIDENALQNISVVLNLAKEIKKKAGGDDAADEFPSLLWVLRDFLLNIEDENGYSITPKIYLENALKEQKGFSENIENKNKLRRMITHFFKERDCICLIRPVEAESDLQNLNNLDDKYIRPEFLKQANEARIKIFKKIKTKKINTKEVNGNILLEYAQIFVENINNGQIPNIESTWNYVCKSENEKNIKLIIDELSEKPFENDIKKRIKNGDNDILTDLFNKLSIKFKNICLGDPSNYLQLLKTEISNKIETINMSLRKSLLKKYKKDAEDKINDITIKLDTCPLEDHDKLLKELEELKLESNNFSKDEITIFEDFKNEKKVKIMEKLYKINKEKSEKIKEEEHKKNNNTILELKENHKLEISNLNFEIANLNNAINIQQNKIAELETKDNNNSKIIEDLKLKNLNNESLKKEIETLKNNIKDIELEKKQLSENILKLKADNLEINSELKKVKLDYDLLVKTANDKEEKLKNKINNIKNNKKEDFTLQLKLQEQTDLANNFKYENKILQKEIELLTKQIEENKLMNNNILKALQNSNNNTNNDNSKDKEIELMNKINELKLKNENLKSEISNLEVKNNKLKEYRNILSNIKSVNCYKCLKKIKVPQIIEHQELCNSSPITFDNKQIQCNLLSNDNIVTNKKIIIDYNIYNSNNEYKLLYVINIFVNNFNVCLNKSLLEIRKLYYNLLKDFKEYFTVINIFDNNDNIKDNDNVMNNLTKFFEIIVDNKVIFESLYFKHFIKIVVNEENNVSNNIEISNIKYYESSIKESFENNSRYMSNLRNKINFNIN